MSQLLGLAADLGSELLPQLLPAGDEDAVPSPGREGTRRRRADARRRSGDDGDPLHGVNLQPPLSERVAPGELARLLVLGTVLLGNRPPLEALSVQRSSTTWPWRRSGRRITLACGRGSRVRQTTT